MTPGSPEVHNALGAALQQRGDREAARAEFQEAARLTKLKNDHEAAILATNTGIERLRGGDLDSAIERFEAAIKLDPDYAEAN